ncbi:MAG: hypothetical protein M3362_23805, partial [Acidobacteriota bacterium]|nr:hypothetical protein [Acidobacteriota bacterium]
MTKTKPRTFGLVELLRREKEQATENISPGTDESPTIPDSPSVAASPSTSESPSSTASPVKLRALGVSDESPSASARAFMHDSPKQRKSQNEKEYRKGDSRVNHDFFDDRICGLDPLSQLLYFHLNRYREASSNLTVTISWSRLMERIP